ncbi:hypothetical protein C453_10595 [Haloferax elongans ATCC BAA-1513]|uniref:Uncharacterized protein n=1 Tax=Haloferax elongans ATCC BAA-1513 TaxID=1230453 RepID=M0HMP1_HALEO|nr:hypothetical protein [Haloferax elongans]ELZ85023.1 hypothetical protein C453_10595 [Haloferax elongans ATCC BAA-1513]
MADNTDTHDSSDHHDYYGHNEPADHHEHSHGHSHEHSHEPADEIELTECPGCGEPIRGADDIVRGDSVPEIRSIRKRSVMVGRQPNDLWLCKGCGATLGVRVRD